MKTLKLAVLLCFAVAFAGTAPFVLTSCTTTQQVVTVRTLETVGMTAKAVMDTSAALYHNDKITKAQYDEIAAFYDHKFQPVFNLAVAAVHADLGSFAPADVLALADQFAALVASYQPKS